MHGMENVKLETGSVPLLRFLCPELFIKIRLIRLTFRTLSTEFGRLQAPILRFRLGCGAASLYEGISNLEDETIMFCMGMSAANHPVKHRHIPEVRRPQIHCCKSLSTSTIVFFFSGIISLSVFSKIYIVYSL